MKFSELGLDEVLLASVQKLGFEEATPIQAQTIPLAIAGQDVIGQAQTGTGKTAAFGLPMLQKIDVSKRRVQGLVIAPTRELAIQTQEELFRLSRDKKVRVQVVYGGADIGRQIKLLKEAPHIVVGTPGRLLDHIKRKTLRLHDVETLVLDEADEMLNMGFLEDIETIISEVPEQRQTLLFSATMPPAIKQIGVRFMRKPQHVRIKAKEMTATLIEQFFIKCRELEKFDIMTRLFDVQNPELTIVFGRTKRRVDELATGLEARGYRAEGIHGDLSQQKRLSVLKAFKNGQLDVLVATDVAARGLDISGVTHVYNYDIPQDPESYVHRIGRTGRAGQEGVSITLVTPNEMDYLRTIEELTRKRMTPLRPPTSEEAFAGQLKSTMEQLEKSIQEANKDLYVAAARDLLTQHPAEEIVASLLKMTSPNSEEVPVTITPEKPLPNRKRSRSNSATHHNNRRGGHNSRYQSDKPRHYDATKKGNRRNSSSSKEFKPTTTKRDRTFQIRKSN